MNKTLNIYTDGGARRNPGPAASSFVAIDEGKVIHKNSLYLGVRTNNEAEYEAVILALSWLINNLDILEHKDIVFKLDSELVARQLSGIYKIKSPNLRILVTKIKNLESRLEKKIKYISVRREKNKLADVLVNRKLDENMS